MAHAAAAHLAISGPGMEHAPARTRVIYSSATPSFKRQPDHYIPRSLFFPGIRRHPLSPTTTPITFNPLKIDAGGYETKGQQNILPLNPMTSLGILSYADEQANPTKVEINGTIDKGFFLAENEWTRYRRNYFSCVCSYSLSPLSPNFPNSPMQFVQTGTQQTYQVYGFAMCISAVVADNDNHTIELVQHTPKRDKGPVAKPEKVRLSPKPAQPNHHPLSGLYRPADPSGPLASSRAYDHQGSFGQPHQSSAPTEHTFERIQFKQATANNGKRRAVQQYYHLLVELWADVGSQEGSSSSDPFVKVAYRKSAKVIVRGRSPGYYQSERRGSMSSGGSIGGGGGYALALTGEYWSSDPRSSSSSYGGMERMITAEEVKSITEPKGYPYFPAPIYEETEQQDPRHHSYPYQQVELSSRDHSNWHARGSEPDGSSQHSSGIAPSLMSASGRPTVKSEMMDASPTGGLSLLYPGTGYYAQCHGYN